MRTAPPTVSITFVLVLQLFYKSLNMKTQVKPICFITAYPASGGDRLVRGHQGWCDAAGPARSPFWTETGESHCCFYSM